MDGLRSTRDGQGHGSLKGVGEGKRGSSPSSEGWSPLRGSGLKLGQVRGRPAARSAPLCRTSSGENERMVENTGSSCSA